MRTLRDVRKRWPAPARCLLFVSPRTASTHLYRIYPKLGSAPAVSSPRRLQRPHRRHRGKAPRAAREVQQKWREKEDCDVHVRGSSWSMTSRRATTCCSSTEE